MKRWHWIFNAMLLAAPFVASSFGCAESSTTPAPTGGTDTGSSSTGSGSGASSSGGSSGQGGSAGTAKLVINEIQATGEDWVEIVNIGDAVADLSGMGLSDMESEGVPKLAEAVRFIEGAKLVPGEYLLVVTNLATAGTGQQDKCLASGGPATCYQGTWGISGSNGDQIFLLSATDEVVDTVPYPANAVLDGQSYCRLPNGIGELIACKPTPSELNAAP